MKSIAGRRRPRRAKRLDPFAAPADAAKAAALRHVSDDSPGIQRRKSGKGFSYASPDGAVIRDRDTLARIRALAIPPAWTSVWICTHPEGHIQATGRDARGRKQYRYHPDWRTMRDATKYERMLAFGAALPKIRARVREDLALPGLPRDKVLAIIVQLLETTFMRVGNEEYAKANKSFGLTTLLNRHVDIDGGTIRFRFRGKSGKTHDIEVHDRRLARLVARCRDLPGQDLFQYVDDDGHPQPVGSSDVNEYLKAISGEDFTAKDFRTWAGTLLAATELTNIQDDEAVTKASVNAAIAAVANQLGNTPTICRKCYIHPRIIDAFTNAESLAAWSEAVAASRSSDELAREEAALLRFLEVK